MLIGTGRPGAPTQKGLDWAKNAARQIETMQKSRSREQSLSGRSTSNDGAARANVSKQRPPGSYGVRASETYRSWLKRRSSGSTAMLKATCEKQRLLGLSLFHDDQELKPFLDHIAKEMAAEELT